MTFSASNASNASRRGVERDGVVLQAVVLLGGGGEERGELLGEVAEAYAEGKAGMTLAEGVENLAGRQRGSKFLVVEGPAEVREDGRLEGREALE